MKEKIIAVFGFDDDECRTAIGAETGCDIKFSKKAHDVIGLSIECKDVKSINIWKALEQARSNTPNGSTEAVIFKRGTVGQNKTYICIPLDHYLDLRSKELHGIKKEET